MRGGFSLGKDCPSSFKHRISWCSLVCWAPRSTECWRQLLRLSASSANTALWVRDCFSCDTCVRTTRAFASIGETYYFLLRHSAPCWCWRCSGVDDGVVGSASASVLVLLAIGECLCGQLTTCISQIFQAFEKMRVTATLSLLTNFLRLLLATGMLIVLHHATAWDWAIASVAVSIVAAVTAFVTVTIRFGWPKFVPALFVKRLGEGFVFAVSGSTTSAYNDVDKVMLGHYGMTVANGIYSIAYRVINICTMPIMSIYGAAFPRFFREGVNGARTTEPFARRLLTRTFVLGILGAVGMFVLAPVIPYVVGKGFSQSVAALRWLCLIPAFRSLHVGAGDAMSGAGYQKYRLASQAVAAGANFCMNLYLIPHYSWVGAAWASLLTDGGLAAMSWTVLLWLKRTETARLPIVQSGVVSF